MYIVSTCRSLTDLFMIFVSITDRSHHTESACNCECVAHFCLIVRLSLAVLIARAVEQSIHVTVQSSSTLD